MTHIRTLDICCGVGGIAKGYDDAGSLVYGVDIADQPNFPYALHKGDAIHVLLRLLAGEAVDFHHRDGRVEWLGLGDFDFVHASFPCQRKNPLSTGTNKKKNAAAGKEYPDLITPGRPLLIATGLPWVIENTAGNPIRKDLRLVGDMLRNPDGTYRLAVWRPRYFEFSQDLRGVVPQPPYPKRRGRTRGWRHNDYFDGPYFAVYGDGGGKASLEEGRMAMAMPWAKTKKELAEAVPPPYSEYIGEHVFAELAARKEIAA